MNTLLGDQNILKFLKHKMKSYDELVFTGHSLGGAMAEVAAAIFYAYVSDNEIKSKVRVYTFGSPKIGEEDT